MPGLTFSNELISRDEGLHTDFACLLYRQAIKKLDESVVHTIIKDAVEAEKVYVRDSLPVNLIGMNSERMITYVQFVADRLLYSLGHAKIYNSENPFEWMEMISLQVEYPLFFSRVGTLHTFLSFFFLFR